MNLLTRAVRERRRSPGLGEPLLVRWLLVGIALLVMACFLILPLSLVLSKALSAGFSAYVAALRDPVGLSAIKLTVLAALVAVPVNVVFGIAAAWLLTRFE